MVSFKSPKLDLLNTSQMKSIQLFKHFLVFVFFLCCLHSNIGYAQQSCNNELQLISTTSNDIEVSIHLKITTSVNYTCVLYKFQDGEYKDVFRKSGNNESNLTFSSLDRNATYKVIAEFESGTTLCRVRQIGGLSL